MPMISISSGGSSSFATSSESAIWGTAAGDTNDIASMCLNPALIKARKYSSLMCVGICIFSPCHASRGHSTSLTESDIYGLLRSDDLDNNLARIHRCRFGKRIAANMLPTIIKVTDDNRK